MEKVICIFCNESSLNSKEVENRVNEHLEEGWVVKDFKVSKSASTNCNTCSAVLCFVLKK